jgi:5-methylthioadenosine/S-adenosylhomocysteine deaminase
MHTASILTPGHNTKPGTTIPKLLISNVTLIASPKNPLIHKQWLLCEGNTIHSHGSMETIPSEPDAQHIDGNGKILLPGLINSHNHSAMTLFRGMADDLELNEWLNEHIFPAEARNVTPEMVYWCSKLAAAEMILSGTTTVADGYFYEEQAARAFLDSGMRAVPAQAIIDFPAPGVPDPKMNIQAAEDFLCQWQNRDERITPALFAHSPYTCSPQTLRQGKALATKYNTLFFIHIAESRHEQQLMMAPQGTSPIKHLAALNLLDSTTVLIHCVWLDDEDRELIRKSKAGVIICPQSHFKLASGLAEVTKLNDLGIKTGLGTDGCASNNSLDMFQEMDFLAKSQKLRTLDASALPANQALSAATKSNAQILGFSDLGTISAGHKADLIMLNTNQPHLLPCYSSDSLTYNTCGSDVDTVIINGTIVLHEGRFLSLDVEECMAEVRKLAHTLGAI